MSAQTLPADPFVVRAQDYPMPVAGYCTCGGYPHTTKCPRVLRVAGAPIRL